MSHLASRKIGSKPPHTDSAELYEEMQSPMSSEYQNNRYVSQPGLPPRPSVSSTIEVTKKSSKRTTLYLLSGGFLIVCLLVVCLLAVILYSSQVRPSTGETATTSAQTMDALLSRIEQLENRVKQLQTIQGTNYTLDTLTSLQETQESMEASIDQLSAFERSASSQLTSVQNLVQSQGSVQNNLRQDLDRLRSVDLSQSCTKLTRSCTVSTGGSSSYYWRYCSTGYISINPSVSHVKCSCLHSVTPLDPHTQDTQYYYEDMRCEYEPNTSINYIESATLRKSGNRHYCWCDVTRFSGTTSSTHSTLSSSLSVTCTLTVTRCPRSVNLLS